MRIILQSYLTGCLFKFTSSGSNHSSGCVTASAMACEEASICRRKNPSVWSVDQLVFQLTECVRSLSLAPDSCTSVLALHCFALPFFSATLPVSLCMIKYWDRLLAFSPLTSVPSFFIPLNFLISWGEIDQWVLLSGRLTGSLAGPLTAWPSFFYPTGPQDLFVQSLSVSAGCFQTSLLSAAPHLFVFVPLCTQNVTLSSSIIIWFWSWSPCSSMFMQSAVQTLTFNGGNRLLSTVVYFQPS